MAASSARSTGSSSVTSGSANGAPVAPATSRATPATDMRSGRFGLTSMSKTTSSRPKCRFTSAPTGESAGRTRIPPWSAETPSSRAEHTMPWDTWPASFRSPRGSGSTGTRDPGRAHGTRSPARKFLTPATTWCSPSPAWIVAMQSLLESG